MNAAATILIWHRNDLRISDHAALEYARRHGFRIVGCFCAVAAQWQAHGHGQRRLAWYERAAAELKQAYEHAGMEFILLQSDDYRGAVTDLQQLIEKIRPTEVAVHAEYELNEYRRDCRLAEICKHYRVALRIFHDQMLINPEKIRNKAGHPFKVYTPFMKSWRSMLDNARVMHPETRPILAPAKQSLEQQAQQRLSNFTAGHISAYAQARDAYATAGTAEISAYLAVGLLTTRQCHVAALAAKNDQNQEAVEKWRDELIWREFYKYIAYHFPHVCRGQSFRHEYDALRWEFHADWLEAWKSGQTGYPVIDAAQRCLLASGFMPNRLRMMTAMFLTKDLGMDWRHGERWFMAQLLDGDFAANNGGWQWSASTGVDAAPYFRIFNPIEQSKKFDPQGAFIRRWLPELAGLNHRDIHWPDDLQRQELGYPQPLVDHKQARKDTLARFDALKSS